MPRRASGASRTIAVDAIRARERAHRVHLRAVQPPLLVERGVGPAQVQAVARRGEVRRLDDAHALRVDVDRRRALHGLGDRLHPDPASGVARHREPDEAEVEVVLHGRGVEHGNHRRDQHLLALVRGGRRLARVVVAGQQQHAAARRGAREVRVLQHVGRAVDARDPCRRRCRTRRRRCGRRRGRPAACPTARSPRGPRSRRAGT